MDRDFLSKLRWWRRPRIWFLSGTVLLLCAIVCVYLESIDWRARPGPPPRDVLDAAGDRPELVGTAYVHEFWGNFIDRQYLWRVELKAELLPSIMREFGVVELASAENVPSAFWHHRPYWWNPKRSRPGRYFMSPRFDPENRGPDGRHYLLMYDETVELLYVWFKDNF